MWRGTSYNAVLIVVPLLFWAVVKWRTIVGWAIAAWRERRAPSPESGPDATLAAEPQVTSPTGLPGEGLGRASEGGPVGVAGEGLPPWMETRDGVRGAWIRVQAREDGSDA